MQIFIKSNTKISRNTSTSNYNNKIMQKKMMSDNDMSAISLTIKHDQESFMNEQENKMRIICTIMRQKQFKTSRT